MMFKDDVRAEFYTSIAMAMGTADLDVAVREATRVNGTVFYRERLNRVAASVSQGRDLWEAMAEHPSLFPAWEVAMVRTGENAGKLGLVLEVLAPTCSGRRVNLAAYWLNLVVVVFWVLATLRIAAIFLVNIVPSFKQMSVDLFGRGPLPYLTQFVLWISMLFTKYGLLMLGIGGGAFVLYLLMATAAALQNKRPFAVIPWYGDYLLERDCERLSGTLGVLVVCGKSVALAARDAVPFVRTNVLKARLNSWCSMGEEDGCFQDGVAQPLAPDGALRLFQEGIASLEPSDEANDFLALASSFRARAVMISSDLNSIIVVLYIFLILGVGVVTLSMFMPLITVIEWLG